MKLIFILSLCFCQLACTIEHEIFITEELPVAKIGQLYGDKSCEQLASYYPSASLII